MPNLYYSQYEENKPIRITGPKSTAISQILFLLPYSTRALIIVIGRNWFITEYAWRFRFSKPIQ